MTIEARIQELLAVAEPLRSLPFDDPDAKMLGPLVDEINALRAMQDKGLEIEPPVIDKPRRGRPPKVQA